jgi:hypothetical protein
MPPDLLLFQQQHLLLALLLACAANQVFNKEALLQQLLVPAPQLVPATG